MQERKPSIRIVLADDHPVVRRGIRSMLEKASDLVVVGEAGGGVRPRNASLVARIISSIVLARI